MAQAFVRPVLPTGHRPLVEELLKLSDRPDRLCVYVRSAAGGVPARITCHVLAEQRVDRPDPVRRLRDLLARIHDA